MTIATNNPKTIDQKTPTWGAVIQVLTTSAWVTGIEAVDLLKRFSYLSTTSKLYSGLSRMCHKGYVENQKRKGDGYGRKEWRLTAVGLQLSVNGTPPAKVKIVPTNLMIQGKKTPMCIDPSKITLNAAISSIVTEFITASKTFSAYDVTKELRDRVIKGSVDLDKTETSVITFYDTTIAKVDHDYVRDAVHELFHQSKMQGYDRSHNGSYWSYAPTPVVASDPDPTTPNPSGTPPASSDYDGSPAL